MSSSPITIAPLPTVGGPERTFTLAQAYAELRKLQNLGFTGTLYAKPPANTPGLGVHFLSVQDVQSFGVAYQPLGYYIERPGGRPPAAPGEESAPAPDQELGAAVALAEEATIESFLRLWHQWNPNGSRDAGVAALLQVGAGRADSVAARVTAALRAALHQ